MSTHDTTLPRKKEPTGQAQDTAPAGAPAGIAVARMPINPIHPIDPIDPPVPPRPRPVPTPTPAQPSAHGNTMNAGEVLPPGQVLTSSNGNYRLTFQTDGNLVLYSGNVPLWASNTSATASCIMQTDGNLVVYAAGGHAAWASNTNGNPGSHLTVQDDGNVVIYRPDGRAVWASNTVRTVGDSTLIYRARIKRWTNIPFFGTKGNDTLLVPLPPGAKLKSVAIEPINTISANPEYSSPIGSTVGNAGGGAQLKNVVTASPNAVVIASHWWFDLFQDAEYSISVWVSGPQAYPILDDGTLDSAVMDAQIMSQIGQWFVNNGPNLAAAAAALVTLCADIATLGTAAAVTTPVLVLAIGAAMTADAKLLTSPSKT